jgi:hypothetical protein
MKVRKYVCDLDRPLGNRPFVNTAPGISSKTARQVAARDLLHNDVKASLEIVKKVIVDRGYSRMI